MIKSVINLVMALQSNSSPGEIAAGVVLGLFVGLTPMSGTHLLVFALLFFFLKIQKGATVLTVPVVKLVYVLGFSRLLDMLGYYLLTGIEPLKPFWAWCVDAPVVALMNFNQTLVLGGCVMALALSVPVYLAATAGVRAYRSYFHAHLEKWGAVRWIKGLSFFKWVSSWWPGSNE